MDRHLRAVLLFQEGGKTAIEINNTYGISTRTIRRWLRAYSVGELESLKLRKPGLQSAGHAISETLKQRILKLKQKHPCWGARRIKYQYNLPVHWRTLHNTIKKNGLLVRIKAKPQPSRRFQRRQVDSL